LTSHWYVLSCTPRKERVIYHQLRAKGFDVFFPYLIVRTKDPNTLKIESYFPGYLFVKTDITKTPLSTFQWMPMTSGLICIDGKPALVPERMILGIHKLLKRTNSVVLGVPDELVQASETSQSEKQNGRGDVFDLSKSGGVRAKELLRVLSTLAETPE
jgi:transcription antitermination factor NusG